MALPRASVARPRHVRVRREQLHERVEGHRVAGQAFARLDEFGPAEKVADATSRLGHQQVTGADVPVAKRLVHVRVRVRLAAGANALTEPEGLVDALATARFPAGAPPLYGDGHASERIAAVLVTLPQ